MVNKIAVVYAIEIGKVLKIPLYCPAFQYILSLFEVLNLVIFTPEKT